MRVRSTEEQRQTGFGGAAGSFSQVAGGRVGVRRAPGRGCATRTARGPQVSGPHGPPSPVLAG